MNISKIKIQRSVASIAMSFCVAVAVLVFALPAIAQDGKGKDKDRRDKDRSSRDRDRDRDLEREKWKQKFDLKSYLNKLDDNKSGVLESKEMKGDRTRAFLSQMGIDTQNPVQIEAALKKIQTKYAKKRDAERKKFEDQVGPKLNSFGTETSPIGVSAFGEVETKVPTVTSFDQRVTGLKPSDFDEQTMKKARKILEGYDRDKSGFLEGDEIRRIRWRDEKPSDSDLNGDGRISLLEMAQHHKPIEELSEEETDHRDAEREARLAEGRKDRLSKLEKKFKFGKVSAADQKDSSKSSRSNKRTSKSTKAKDNRKEYAKYVDGVYKKYDLDEDNRLSKDELDKMRRPFKGDTDGDGFLTKTEATTHLMGGKTKKTEESETKVATNDPSAERRRVPPKGPDYLASQRGSSGGAKPRGSLSNMDTNSDGQIQMAEFATTWDEDTLQRFRKTDTDQDGIISADEWSKRSK